MDCYLPAVTLRFLDCEPAYGPHSLLGMTIFVLPGHEMYLPTIGARRLFVDLGTSLGSVMSA
jgi:hypothetical protein